MTVLASNGNVGIGTTTPGEQLEIYKLLGGGTLQLSQGTNDSSVVIGQVDFFNKATPSPQVSTRIQSVRSENNYYNTDLRFFTSPNDGSITERMRIKGNGNIGIGTSGPLYTLDVSGTGSFN
ncbi:TPA: hypothetical protein DCZ39_07870 [Patescibacteria group bacterium]|nr:hypothetical protein [Candidatus Gracilibacteria bacterium]